MDIILLTSGKLGFKCLPEIIEKHTVKTVFTDRKSVAIIEYCSKKNIPVFAGNPRSQKGKLFSKQLSCDLLLSINYLYIVEEELLNLPTLYAVNLHGSLLPKYRGRTPHVWAIINGEKETGITAHLMEKGVDTGAILHQKKIPISPENTGADILEKFEKAYPEMIDVVLDKIKRNSLQLQEQNYLKATYFGKRTPEDGLINWNWSKERIYNWIRAQARPYPGAFTYFNKQKIIIHQANDSDFGFDWQMPNGLVVDKQEESLIVKTPNGCLEISKLEGEFAATIKNKTIFNEFI